MIMFIKIAALLLVDTFAGQYFETEKCFKSVGDDWATKRNILL